MEIIIRKKDGGTVRFNDCDVEWSFGVLCVIDSDYNKVLLLAPGEWLSVRFIYRERASGWIDWGGFPYFLGSLNSSPTQED